MDENTSAQSTESTSDHPGAGQTTAIQPAADPAVRFRGLGTNFRAKLIGIDDVQDSRGDQMCQESILKLKAAVLASGRHKQKVIINVSLEGIKIVDVLTGEVQHVHPVHRISFIARDLTDRRAFGYVYGVGEGKHQFFGIKTAKVAEVLVLALRDLFQVVYDMKKKEIEDAKSGKIVINGPEKTEENQPVLPTPSQEKQQNDPHAYQQSHPAKDDGNILNLEQQLTTIQQGINNIDAIGPWSQDLPTSPDTPGDMGGDLFGMANLSDISSLSSDFSCASNVVIDYGHTGAPQKFERTGSARSNVSNQGGDSLQIQPTNQHSGNINRVLSIPAESKPPVPKTATIKKEKQGADLSVEVTIARQQENVTECGKIQNRSPVCGNNNENQKASTLKTSTSMQSLSGSEKESKKQGSSFFSRHRKSSRRSKHKKHKKESGVKEKKQKSTSDSENSHKSRVSSDVHYGEKTTSVSELKRRESISSVNSVRSCIYPTTVQVAAEPSEKSLSRSSLNVVARSGNNDVKSANPSLEDKSPRSDSYIIRSSINPRSRPRPKKSEPCANKEKESQNYNQEMKENLSSLKDNLKYEPFTSPSTLSTAWVASFDDDFKHFEKDSANESPVNEGIDPFTGLAVNELQATSSVFDDTSWTSDKLNNENVDQQVLPHPIVEDFSSDPFSATALSPFEGNDPFITFVTEDPFSGTEVFDNVPYAKEETANESNKSEVVVIPSIRPTAKNSSYVASGTIANGEEDEPPSEGTAQSLSPNHELTNSPPLIPPRLPPRPQKKVGDESADIKGADPPPLPNRHIPSAAEDHTIRIPPAIPERAFKSRKESPGNGIKWGTLQSNSTNGASKQTSSYSDELFDLASPVAQPVPQPGAKLTKEQILSGFGSAQQQSAFPAQAGMYMMPPNQMQYQYNQGQVQPQQQMFAVPQTSPPIGMFPPGPGPAIPPRPGAMKPPGSQPLPGGAPQNPFGDSGLSQTAPMLAPNVGSSNNQAVDEAPKPSDPFASLVPGMGNPVPNKKDMFKNFQMAKPPQPPPRTNPPVNISQNDQPAMEQPSNFENYFLNSVGGVPIADDAANNNPAPAPRKQVNANDAFGIGADAFSQPAAGNVFASDQVFSQPFDFNQGGNNSQSLFG